PATAVGYRRAALYRGCIRARPWCDRAGTHDCLGQVVVVSQWRGPHGGDITLARHLRRRATVTRRCEQSLPGAYRRWVGHATSRVSAAQAGGDADRASFV